MRHFLAMCALVLIAAARASAAIPSTERDALVALYQSTAGQAWTNKTNWLGANGTECTWFGVQCDEQSAHVIELSLYQNNLDGTLPPDLRKLTALRQLLVWQNNLRGSLPPEIGELSQLEGLYASNNHLTGKIPPQWGALKKLSYFEINGNELTGPLPPEIGGMTSLIKIDLSYNAINGPLPKEIANLTNLAYVLLQVNELTGSIPKEIGSMPKLDTLSITNNQLSGPIPPELGNLPELTFLGLSYNNLTGGIPKALGHLRKLEWLDLASNPLGGTIPSFGGDNVEITIKVLNFDNTQLTGEIPPDIYDFDKLEELHLGYNQLGGTIPPDIAKLENLQVLALWNNDFKGTIPAAISNIAPLRSLELEGNDFEGTIPPELARLTNLEVLDLSGNRLTGSIPPQLGTLAKLDQLILYDNELTGGIPPELGALDLGVLYLGGNHLGGTIPDSLRHLAHLQHFSADGNGLTGEIPFWINEWSDLRDLRLAANLLRGNIPTGLAQLQQLTYLDLSGNLLTGSLPDVSRMKELEYIYLHENFLSGPMPASYGALPHLVMLQLQTNSLSGPIPKELGELASLGFLNLGNNSFEGTIPVELAALSNLGTLSLYGNRLGGTIPPQLGNLSKLESLDLAFNALRGPIPKELTRLTNLANNSSDFQFNALYTSDDSVRKFVNAKQGGNDFEATQTVTPLNVRIMQTTDRNATLNWTPIRYYYNDGGYQVSVSKSQNGPPVFVTTTSNKQIDTILVRNLEGNTRYYFTVSAVTHPHDYEKNLLVSDPSPVATTMTLARQAAPPDVDVTQQPTGMVQIDGAEVVFDELALTNFGDAATSLQLLSDGGFFTVTPQQLTLAGGETKTVTLHSLPRGAGRYDGNVFVQGAGTNNGLTVGVVLLSTARPAGTVVAQAVRGTVEIAGALGLNTVGTAQFRNAGTAPLTGIVLSDQPWIEPPHEAITIEPGGIATINFRVLRSRRPAGEGSLVANLRLVYVNGGTFSGAPHLLDGTTSGVSVSIVTVVDTTTPTVTSGSIPPLGAELALFVPGLRGGSNTRSDLSILNALGTHSISDLRLYFTHSGATNIAALQPLGAASGLSLVNVINSIYSTSDNGTMQIRTGDAEGISVDAKVTNVTTGNYTTAVPVFRSDRSLTTSASLYLAGLSAPGDLLIQETAGGTASAHIVFLDAAGNTVATRDEAIDPFALVERNDVIPANAAAAIVTSTFGSFTAYARLRDANGDAWSVADWSQFYRYTHAEAVRVPYADGASGVSKRRTIRHDAMSNATGPHFSTTLAFFNPGSEETRANVDVVETNGHVSTREVVIAPHATVLQSDVAGSASTSTAHVKVTPTRGEIVVTARSRGATGGTTIPVVAATSGLRLGQTQTFTALEDTSTLRTSYGFVETAGSAATVRARIFIEGSNALVTAVTERDYAVGAGQQLFVPELLRSFAGPARDTMGDLHNLVLEIEIVAGSGAVVPFLLEADGGSGDLSMRVP